MTRGGAVVPKYHLGRGKVSGLHATGSALHCTLSGYVPATKDLQVIESEIPKDKCNITKKKD